MFEFGIDDPRDIWLRVGRFHLRTWPDRFMLLPRGYRAPKVCWAVEHHNADGTSTGQLAAFLDEAEAQRCIAQLENEGWTDLVVNMIPVHTRLTDWEFDR